MLCLKVPRLSRRPEKWTGLVRDPGWDKAGRTRLRAREGELWSSHTWRHLPTGQGKGG